MSEGTFADVAAEVYKGDGVQILTVNTVGM